MSTAIVSAKRTYRADMTDSGSLASHHDTAWKIIFPCLIVLITGLAYIWLQSNTEKLQRTNTILQQQHQERTRQLTNLRLERETQTSRSEILRRVTELNLDLGPALFGQTRRITLQRDPSQPVSSEGSLMAQR